MLVIRKLDNYNFVLSKKLDEAKVVTINGKDIVYEYKNMDLFYGNLYEAIRGMLRHNKEENIVLNKNKLIKIKPSSNSNLYMPFLEVGNNEIRDIVAKVI